MFKNPTSRHHAPGRSLLIAGASLFALATFANQAVARGYFVSPLVTDSQSVLEPLGYGAARTVDPALINPWDLTSSSTGPWVVANAFGAGTATVYGGNGKVRGPTVSIPEGSQEPFGPTGAVFVGHHRFQLPGGGAAVYIFDNLDGSISGWDGVSATAQTLVAGRTGGNVAAYTGLEIAQSGGVDYLYAVNGITGTIDVFNTSYQKVTLAGAFVDPGPNPKGLVPFNAENLDAGHLWVSYATPGPAASGAALGVGFVSEFNTDGTFVRRFATGGSLSSPWGMAVAPVDFGAFSQDILIGNFNDGATEAFISAFDPNTGQFLGKLKQNGALIVLPGLWALHFGNGGRGGSTSELYFTAGIGGESHGLFGKIFVAPDTSKYPSRPATPTRP